jgi:cytochrome c-type biogenesis protein
MILDLREPLARMGGVVVMLFGLATMGLFGDLSRQLSRLEHARTEGVRRWWLPSVGWMKSGIDLFLRYFYADTRADFGRRNGGGYMPSFLMGIFFSAGWTPCIGPTLGAILALGYSSATIGQGAWLLAGYSLGLGIPFLLFALALDRASGLLRLLKRHIRTIQLINGTLLVLIGFALLTKQLTVIARWAQENNLYLEAGSTGETTPTFFIAVLAGLFSFLSPCVLPLVPAYVFYLTGHTFSKTAADRPS